MVLDEPKHRAFQFLMFHALDTMSVVGGALRGVTQPLTLENRPQSKKPLLFMTKGDYMYEEWKVFVMGVFQGMNPKFFSYMSGQVSFDSAVFSHATAGTPDSIFEAVKSLVRQFPLLRDSQTLEDREYAYKDISFVRRIAATLAIRTQRTSVSR